MEKPVDAVTAVAPHHREATGLSVFLDDVPQLSVADAGLHCGAESMKVDGRKPCWQHKLLNGYGKRCK